VQIGVLIYNMTVW